MPSVVQLEQSLTGYGYTVRTDTIADRTLHGTITGAVLKNVSVIARANEDLCNCGLMVGVLDAVPERSKYLFLLELFELNFNHPLARLGMFYAKSGGDGDSTLGVVVAETSFFWTELTKTKFDARMTGLYAIARAASMAFATRDALTNANPFYEELKPTASPAVRGVVE